MTVSEKLWTRSYCMYIDISITIANWCSFIYIRLLKPKSQKQSQLFENIYEDPYSKNAFFRNLSFRVTFGSFKAQKYHLSLCYKKLNIDQYFGSILFLRSEFWAFRSSNSAFPTLYFVIFQLTAFCFLSKTKLKIILRNFFPFEYFLIEKTLIFEHFMSIRGVLTFTWNI